MSDISPVEAEHLLSLAKRLEDISSEYRLYAQLVDQADIGESANQHHERLDIDPTASRTIDIR